MIANAKRTASERKNVHSWHPYYAGYSETFVESVLQYEKINFTDKTVVLDPWIGSGTTGVVCQKNGVNCIGIDINPCMATFSAAKSNKVLSLLKENNQQILESILNRARTSRRKFDVTHLSEFSNKTLSQKILRVLFSIEKEFEYLNNESQKKLNPIESFFKSVLLVSNRQLLGYKHGSNPTWYKKSLSLGNYEFKVITDVFKKNYEIMIEDLYESISNSTSNFDVFVSNSTNLCLQDESVDLVITSPPYLTRIDYAVSTQVELLTLSNTAEYKKIRKQTIGTTTIYSQNKVSKPEWGITCCNCIEQISEHYSYSSQDYYLKNKIQYFDSTFSSLKELFRVMKNDTNAYLVIQNSYYKEINIPLPEIYIQMALNIGFKKGETVRRDILRLSMANINTKSKKYSNDKVYYEDVIRISK